MLNGRQSVARVLPFDQRQRYEVVAALVQALKRPCRLLDVGGFHRDIDGTPQLPIRDVVPEARSFAIDLEPCSLAGYAIADAGHLPFPDRSFDVVSCLDVLEHVPRSNRLAVIAELGRVSRAYLVIAVPHADDGAVAREEALQRFIVANLGGEQVQLREHKTFGLPTHAEIMACLPPEARSFGYGNLDRWTVAMLTKHFIVALPHHESAFYRFDEQYGDLDPAGDRRPPFYRHFYLAAVTQGASVEPIDSVWRSYSESAPSPHSGAEASDLLAMALETLISADSSRLAAERAPLQEQVIESRTHIQNLDGIIEGLQTQIRNQDQALADSETHILNLEQVIEDLRTTIQNREQALSDSQTHILNLEKVIEDLRTEIQNREQTLSASQTHIVNLGGIIQNREQALEDARGHIRNVEASLAAAQAHIDSLRSTLTAVEQSKVYRLYRFVNRVTAVVKS